MKITKQSAQMFEISDLRGLDSIRVILQDCGPGQGRMIVECYGEAWASYWNAMGGVTVREFVRSASIDYVTNCLIRPRRSGRDARYVDRIVMAIHSALDNEATQ